MQADYTILISLGIALILCPLIKGSLNRIAVPPLVGYIALGLTMSALNGYWRYFTPAFHTTFSVIAEIGIIALLFRVGLKSNVGALIAKLPEASFIWIGDVFTNLSLSFVFSYYVLSLDLAASVIIATAFSATSVAVSMALFSETKKLGQSSEQLLIDVAELDDLSGIFLLAILLTVLPYTQNGGTLTDFTQLWPLLIEILLKFSLFIIGCLLFASYVEERFTRFNQRLDTRAGFAIAILGAAATISAIAGYLGFSLAIGAFFAGLAFSRDPRAVHAETGFNYFYDFFTPFFFIHIGLLVDLGTLSSVLGLAGGLLCIAVAGKLIGVTIPALLVTEKQDALLIGISMVPRAEIAMLVAYQGTLLGENILPDNVFAAIILVSVATSILAPMAIKLGSNKL